MAQDASLGAVVNTNPRPRLLVKGFKENSDVVAALLELCPTSRLIESLREVRQKEWDLLVTDQSLTEFFEHGPNIQLESHLSVIFQGRNVAYYEGVESKPEWAIDVSVHHGVISQEIQRVRGLPERIAILVHEELEPVLKLRSSHRHFSPTHNSRGPAVKAFIATPDGHALAGRYSRSADSEAWLLPHDTPDIVAWVKAALGEWHALAPDRFPGVPDWSTSNEWLTTEEVRISTGIAEIEKRRQEELAKLNTLESELREQMATARAAADKYERALLTSQSDELKNAVMCMLQEIGFLVSDADKESASDDHLEDLHIMDPDCPDWIALGEVKGYSKGAKTEGLTQFVRFVLRYSAKHDKGPNSCWYIVNQFMNRDPSTRQPALHGKDEDIAAFGEGNGLVIDTVLLFRLLRQVREGTLTAQDARALLRNSTGRFAL